jgi:thiol-disulfide isomerase/thioredoxin
MLPELPNAKESAQEIAAPPIALHTSSDSDGDPEKLAPSAFAGKAMVLFVLGTNCENCKQVAGLLSGLQDEYAGAVVCIGVCVQPGCRYKLAEFAAQTGCRIQLGSCSTRELCSALRLSVSTWLLYPTLIFIDRDRLMRGHVVTEDTFFENTAANCRAVLDQFLSEASLTSEAA